MRNVIPLCILALILYCTVIYFSRNLTNFDSTSYHTIGALTLKGASIYPDPAISRHPYLPLFLYLEAATLVLSLFFHLSQLVIIKIVLSFFHLASVFAVYTLSKKNLKAVTFYAINPISLLTIAFHGQFDIIPVTCILFSLIALKNKQFVRTILLLSFAIAIKTWPVRFIIPFLNRIPKKYWGYLLVIPSFFCLLYSIFFHTSLVSLARVLLVYQGVGGVWGFGKLLSFFPLNKIALIIFKCIFVCGFLFYSLKQKKTVIIEELFSLLLLFFIFTPGFGLQWFLWLTPFLFLTKKPFTHLFIAGITVCLCISYLSWPPFRFIPEASVNTILFLLWPLFGLYYVLVNRPSDILKYAR